MSKLVSLRVFSTSVKTARGSNRASPIASTSTLSSPSLPSAAPLPPSNAPPHQSVLKFKKYDKLFQTRSRWLAKSLAAGHHIPRELLSSLLRTRKIPAETLSIWVEIFTRRDPVWALTRLGLLESGGEDRERIDCPDWLFLGIPGLVQDKKEVPYLAAMLLSDRFKLLGRQNKGILAARCIQTFLRVEHYVALRELVDWICDKEQEWGLIGPSSRLTASRTFGKCLSALGSHPSRVGSLKAPPLIMIHSLAAKLRKTMRLRGIEETMDTYKPLFDRSLIPIDPKEASSLLIEMQEKGFAPRTEMLHAVMSTYARAGNTKGAQAILDLLPGREETGKEEGTLKRHATITSLNDPSIRPDLDADSTSVKYKTTLLASLDDPKLALQYFHNLRNTTSSIDSVTWSTLTRVISQSRNTTIHDLLSLMESFEIMAVRRASIEKLSYRSRRLYRLRPPALLSNTPYTIIMDAFLKRNAPSLVLRLWRSLVERGAKPDATLLDVVCKAHCRLDDIPAADRLLQFYAHRPLVDPPPHTPFHASKPFQPRPTRKSIKADLIPIPHSVRLDIVPINNLLVALSRSHNYRSVYETLCYGLSRVYGLKEGGFDNASLSLLLDAGRYASAAAGRGYGPGTEKIDWLDEKGEGRMDDIWDGVRACALVEQIMWGILESGWTEGIDWIRRNDCLHGTEGAGNFDQEADVGQAGSTGVLGWVRGKLSSKEDFPTSPRFFRSTLSLSLTPAPLYPQIYPTVRLFRSFLQLLGYHSTTPQISRCLTWMRYLEIKPTRGDLTLAIMYIGEGDPSERSRKRMRRWLANWVGEENVPREDEVAFLRRGGTNNGQSRQREKI